MNLNVIALLKTLEILTLLLTRAPSAGDDGTSSITLIICEIIPITDFQNHLCWPA